MDSTGEDRGGFPKRDKGGGERAKRKPVRGAEDDVRKRTKEVAGADAGAGTGAEPEEQTTTLASTVLAKEREKDERKPMSRGLEEVPPFSMANLSSVMTKTMENGFYRFVGRRPPRRLPSSVARSLGIQIRTPGCLLALDGHLGQPGRLPGLRAGARLLEERHQQGQAVDALRISSESSILENVPSSLWAAFPLDHP